MKISQRLRQVSLRLHRGNAIEIRLESGGAGLIHGRLIHARGVEIADLLVDGPAMRIVDRSVFQNVAQQRPVLVLQLGVHAPGTLVWRNRVLLLPSTTGIRIEVDTGLNAFVHRSYVEPWRVRNCRYLANDRRLLRDAGKDRKQNEQGRVEEN